MEQPGLPEGSQAVEETSPMKRGLKDFISEDDRGPGEVEETSPMKRGLKASIAAFARAPNPC
jgi:hypothetical protein